MKNLVTRGKAVVGDLGVRGVTPGTAAASKPAILDSSKAISGMIDIPPSQIASANGAITIKHGTVFLTKAGVAAMTLADPTATTDDGKVLRIVAVTANAHTVTNTTGINGAGASGDVGTFGGAKGDCIELIAYQGVWYTLNSRNVTLA